MKRFTFLMILSLCISSCTATVAPELMEITPGLRRHYDSLWRTRCYVNPSDVQQYMRLKAWAKADGMATVQPIVSGKYTLAYLLTYKDGWELMSADIRMPPVLAFSRDPVFPEDNAAFMSCLSGALETIELLKKEVIQVPTSDTIARNNALFWKRIRTSEPKTKADGDPEEDDKYWELLDSQWVGDFDDSVDHLIHTHWYQDLPWNMFAPLEAPNSIYRDPAGCTAIAASQMLYFLQDTLGLPATAPTSGYCTGYSSNLTDTTYHQDFAGFSSSAWDNMAESVPDIYYGKSDTLSALWIGFVGKSIGTKYSPSVSQADFDSLPSFLLSQGILSSQPFNYNGQVVYSCIKNQKIPVLMSAHSILDHDFWGNTIYRSGHTFIADAATAYYTIYDDTYVWTSHTENTVHQYGDTKVERDTVLTGKYIRMNWGNDEPVQDNVYFSIYANHFKIYIDDNLTDFQYNLKMIYDFSPAN